MKSNRTASRSRIAKTEPVWRRRIRRHLGRTLVQADRGPEIKERITGYVLDMSDSLILFNLFDWNTFSLDGYVILRLDDIELFRAYSYSSLWEKRAVELLKVRPIPVRINLSDWQSAIGDITKSFPLVNVQRELRFPGECWIGFPIEVRPKSFLLDNLNHRATWTGSYKMRTTDVTRVGFGGGYERALAATAPKRPS